jgi:hypothetical protein
MHHLIALLAGCLLYPPADDPCRIEREAQYEFLRNHPAAGIEWGDNGQVRQLTSPTGIVLPTGIEGFQVDQPAPADLFKKIGPLLLARGTEELRVSRINRQGLIRGTTIHLREFIRGREVVNAWVQIILNEETNEVMHLLADFLPDRGLEHEPRLTAAEARMRLDTELREIAYRELTLFDTPARLAYSFEQWGSRGGIGGALVWAFSVRYPPAGGEGRFAEVMIDAASGEITARENILQYWARQ